MTAAETLAPAERARIARRAGLLYMLACIPAPFVMVYLPRRVFVAADASATTERIRAAAELIRIGVATEVWNCVLIVFAAFALYRLFEEVDVGLASLLAVLMWVAAPIQLLNLVFTLATLLLTSSAPVARAFTKEQIDALAYLFWRLHAHGIQVAQIFWGLWLFPWGMLALRSRFIPRWIGTAVIVAGCGYVVASMIALTAPRFGAIVPFALALGAGELPMGIWLISRAGIPTRKPGAGGH